MEEQKAQEDNWFLRGRHIGNMVCEHFRITVTIEFIVEFCDLLSVTLRGNDVQGFDTPWDEVLFSMRRSSQE